MILFTGTDTTVKTIDSSKFDGVYLGIISSVSVKENTFSMDNTVYNCTIYIPEIYGKYIGLGYPVVEIHYKQDSCDEGHEPQIGELVKVSFDDGDSNSCRLIYVVPTPDEIRIRNANYILNGVLPTTILDINDSQVISKILSELLDYAYYVTTGKRSGSISSADYQTQYSLVSKVKFNNYFISPLQLPTVTGSVDFNYYADVPVFLSNIYLMADVIQTIFSSELKKSDDENILIKLFDLTEKHLTEFGLPRNLNSEGKSMFISSIIAGIPIAYVEILFPFLNNSEYKDLKEKMQFADQLDFTYNCYDWWNAWSEHKEIKQTLSKFIYDYRNVIEKAWSSVCASWWSGLNSMIFNKNNTNLIYTILLCFTLIPWIVYPLFGYEKTSAKYNSSTEIEDFYKSYGIKAATISTTLFKNDAQFEEVSEDLFNLIKDENITPSKFVPEFKAIIAPLYTTESWNKCKMNDKFSRLKEVATNFDNTSITSSSNYSVSKTDLNSSNSNGINLEVPQNQNGFKSWMPYTALSKTSPNYQMIVNKGYVDSNGLWKIGEYYCVALGSYYSKELGDLFEAQLSTGKTIKLIAGDHKADIHTDSTNRYTTSNGCMSEFIVDVPKLNKTIRRMGNVGSLPEFEGTYVKIVKIGNIFNE